MLALLAVPPAGAEAPYEPNDTILSAAGPLAFGQTYSAALETANDQDSFYFYVTAAGTSRISLTVQNLGGGGKSSDIDATILDGSGTPLAGQAFIRDGESRILSATLRPQRYFVEVAANEGFGDSYSLAGGGGPGAFGSYEQIAGRCASAAAAVGAAGRALSHAEAKLQRAVARVRRSRYGTREASRSARSVYRGARTLVRAKRRALRAAHKSRKPWCSIAQ
jgi:hypothetical protein